MRTAALKPLRPYEPWRDGYGLVDPAGQLALDLLALRRPPMRHGTAPEPMPASHVRRVFATILDARTGVRPLSRVQALVHPGLYRQFGLSRPIRDVRFTLKSVRVCQVSPDVYEATGTAHTARRCYAVVGRFELLEQGWRCVLFDLIRPSVRAR